MTIEDLAIEDGIWRQPAERPGRPALEWRFEGGSLAGLRADGLAIEAGEPGFELLDLSVAEGSGRLFPPHFSFDPATGRRLGRRVEACEPFGAPSLRPDGYANLDLAGAIPDAGSRVPVSMPPGAAHVFSAGRPAALFALTAQGDLFLRNAAGAWVPLTRLAAPDLPPFAFGILGLREGFALALGDRLLVCEFGGARPGLVFETRVVEGGRPCGSPAAVENGGIAFPVDVGGRLAIDIFSLRERSWTRVEAAGDVKAGEGFLALPVQVPAPLPDTVWVGADAYLLYGSDFEQRRCEHRAFPDGMRAVLGPPPLRDGSNTLHALVETSAHFAYRSLTRSPRMTPLGGPHLGAGPGSYFGRSFHETLWDDDPVAFQIEAGADRILLPLAYSQSSGDRSVEALVALIDGSDVKALFGGSSERILRAQLYWHSGARLIPLNTGLPLRSRFDLLVYRVGGGLFVGSAVNGAFYRWECR